MPPSQVAMWAKQLFAYVVSSEVAQKIILEFSIEFRFILDNFNLRIMKIIPDSRIGKKMTSYQNYYFWPEVSKSHLHF